MRRERPWKQKRIPVSVREWKRTGKRELVAAPAVMAEIRKLLICEEHEAPLSCASCSRSEAANKIPEGERRERAKKAALTRWGK